MKYGYFDDPQREYVIEKAETPYPWINYLGCEEFFGLVSNTGGGYTFYKDARLRRLTRYRYNNVPLDAGGRYFYIKDGDTVWNPGWKPTKTVLDRYECRHGLGYSRITGARDGVEASVLMMVPQGAHCEIHRVTIQNNASTEKKIQLFSFAEFCLWDAMDDASNYQRNLSIGEVEVEGNVIYHKTEYRERRNHFAFYASCSEIDGFDSDRNAFIGPYNGFHEPQAVMNGACTNSVASGWSPVASHQHDITLAPAESRDFIFILGYAENPKEEKFSAPGIINKAPARSLIERFNTPEKVDEALADLKAMWSSLLSHYQVKTGDVKLDRMVNIWNPYQCMVTFNMSRSASYFESGIGRGMGFRDSNQDLLGFVHQIPDRARERILDIASTQFEDGGNWHQYQPLTKKGNADVGGGFNDDPLWLILATAAYIKETGDWSMLEARVPFDDSGRAATLFEHCKASFYHAVQNRGPHGLPLIGRADWNDCLNLNCYSDTPGEPFQTTANRGEGDTAESVLIAGMFVSMGPEFAAMAEHLGLREEADEAMKHVEAMKQAVLKDGWDGDWFLRAYDANGEPVGSRQNKDGQIFIESQGYCIMAGIGLDNGYAEKALNSVKERLDTPYGVVLSNPPFADYHIELGEVSSYPPGYKENAGIFCHNNPWIMIAETMLGRNEYAWDYYRKICPAYLEDISEIHKMEPYVYAQMIAGKDAVNHGEAKNSWLTGTAAWNYVVVSQHLLGLKPDWNGLRIQPCLPADIDSFEAVRKFRGNLYRIRVQKSVDARGLTLKVNGKTVDGSVVPFEKQGDEVLVECTIPA